MDKKYSEAQRRLANHLDRLAMHALTGTTTNVDKDLEEPFTKEKLMALMKELPPAPPKIQAAPDSLFPKEHYADDVAIIPHHPAHTLFAKVLAPKAPTATVMKAGEKNRPDGTCYQIGDTIYIPLSLASKVGDAN